MEGQTVYSTYNFLDEVFLFKDESEHHALLRDIIRDYSDVMIDIEEDEFENELTKEDSVIKLLNKRPNRKTYALKQFFEGLAEEDLSWFPRDLFLLEESDIFCDNLMKKYGVLIINPKRIEQIQYLAKRYTKSYQKGDIAETQKNKISDFGWSSFTDKFDLRPINSIVLIDNYIFQNEKIGKDNLINLFSSIMPTELGSAFHILIAIDNKNGRYHFEKLDKIRYEIENELSLHFSYKVEVSIASHLYREDFHNRILITNYHLIKSAYGFDCFNAGKANRTNELEIMGVYYTLKRKEGDAEIKLVCSKLEKLKGWISQIDNTKKIGEIKVGNCKNRLLDNF